MKILDKILGGNILYYPGCLTKFVGKDLKENYEKILRAIGIDFIELKEKEVCCGSPALNAGYKKTAEDLARKNYHVFKEHRVKKIISNCPACCKTFSQDYPLLLKEWDIEVEHVSQTIYRAIQAGRLRLKKKIEKIVTFHDPCYLGRYMSIYEEPRKILEFMGCKVVEMKFNRRNSLCCGGGGGTQFNYPELANSIAKERIEQALEVKAEFLITICPLCYYHLGRNSKEIHVFEISQLLVKCI
jgi:Fe-S oxidoreductase